MSLSALVIHSGGMDSSLCLHLAIKKWGKEAVKSLSFDYGQRHALELEAAQKISSDWGVSHDCLSLDFFDQFSSNALTHNMKIGTDKLPSTLVPGRNGLMIWLGALYAHARGCSLLYLGVMERPDSNSGYRDCSREYVDSLETILRGDLDELHFSIATPLVEMSKEEEFELAYREGILDYLLEHSLSCYEGKRGWACRSCGACILKNRAMKSFFQKHSHLSYPLFLRDE